METNNYKNAIEYIKESSLCSSERYSWLKQLIDKCLKDTLLRQDINDLLNQKLQITTSNETEVINQENEEKGNESIDQVEPQPIDLKQILSIEEACNTGLLNIQKPLSLKEGLNIFYGKNGAGKSSLYHPICKTLGFNKHVISKINSVNNTCSFKIKAISKEGKELTMSWKTGEKNQRCNVKIFDSNISNYLVESEQENNFNITHLKSEYFPLLHSLFDEIANSLSQKEKDFLEKSKNKREIINSIFPDFFERDIKIWTTDIIKEASNTDEEIDTLSQIESGYKVLEKSDSESIIKNIINARDQILIILNFLGRQNQIEDDKGKIIQKWTLIFDIDYFKTLTESMQNFQIGNQTFEKQGLETLSGNIRKEWIKNDRWNKFIKSSIDERKIHALADFFAECELNKFQGIYIFDDPVNSLDEERIEYVSERIMNLLNDGNQVIVFTHNLVFLNLLADTQQDKLNKINRLSDQIIIEPNILMDSQQELNIIKKEIDNRIKVFKQSEESSISIMDMRNVYDLISGYLETYVEGKIFKNIITRYRPNIRMQSLEKIESLDTEKIKKLMTLYNQTSRKGSRHSQPIGTPPPKYPDLLKHYEELKTEFPSN